MSLGLNAKPKSPPPPDPVRKKPAFDPAVVARNISAAVSNGERLSRREWLAALMGCSESHARVDQAETMLCVSEQFTHVIDVRHGLRTLVPAYFNPNDEAQERAYEAYKATIEHFGRVIHREMYGRNWEQHARIPMVMVPERQGDRWNGPILLEVPKKDRARFERLFGQRPRGTPENRPYGDTAKPANGIKARTKLL